MEQALSHLAGAGFGIGWIDSWNDPYLPPRGSKVPSCDGLHRLRRYERTRDRSYVPAFFGQKATLFEGLKELHERQIIDTRLYQWGDELRKHRNLAAHASDAQFALNDAKDLHDFATAICEYVFVLTGKFESFQKRQAKTEAAQGQPA